MTRRLKIVAFAVTIAGFTAMAGAYHVGFDVLPPQTMLADGRSVPLDAAGVQACFQARALALISDRHAENYWQACRRRLMEYGALDAFELRSIAAFWRCSDLPSASEPTGRRLRSREARGCIPARQD